MKIRGLSKIAGYVIFVLLFLAGCGEKEVLITGKTMGTTYHIKVIVGYFKNPAELKKKIDKRLEAVNRSMSIYQKNSEISRFNLMKSTDEKFFISDDFFKVMTVAEEIYKTTQGAWDGTVHPLVNLWGFGSTGRREDVPAPEEIQNMLANIGFDKIEISNEHYLKKKIGTVTLDLGSIAPGYGVDQVAELIKRENIKNFLVEIGGEIYASGIRTDGKNWKVGINTPDKDAPFNQVYKALSLRDKAMATSGNYRNFFEKEGKQYSHILDPKTGYPVTNNVVSVSVIADTCTFADGFATALMVMGHEKGIDLVNRLEGVEALIVVHEQDGKLSDYSSKGFKADF